jgi:hypothetical protein
MRGSSPASVPAAPKGDYSAQLVPFIQMEIEAAETYGAPTASQLATLRRGTLSPGTIRRGGSKEARRRREVGDLRAA